MSVEEDKAAPRRVYEQVLSHEHLDLVDDPSAPDYVSPRDQGKVGGDQGVNHILLRLLLGVEERFRA